MAAQLGITITRTEKETNHPRTEIEQNTNENNNYANYRGEARCVTLEWSWSEPASRAEHSIEQIKVFCWFY